MLPAADYTVDAVAGGFAVMRNGKAMHTPAGKGFVVPTRSLAEAIAAEWRAQKDKVIPASMPMTQLAATAIDIIGPNRTKISDEVAKYAEADLLCFFVEEPAELAGRQKKVWQPVLDWCAHRFDALLQRGQGIVPGKQTPEALLAIRRAVESYDDFTFMGMKQAAEVTASLTLGLSLVEKHLTAQQVFEAAELEARFQAEKWGGDPATEKRHESILGELIICQKWFELLK